MSDDILHFLSNKRLMALASFSSEFPWICNVYFVYNDKLEFYFLSSPETIHVQQIKENNKVAFTIADSRQLPEDDKRAIQAWGEANQVTDMDELMWFLNKFTDNPSKYNADEVIKGIGRIVYRITPKKMKFFDTERFKEKGGFEWVI
jgi:uncharacterized protein YhbP (UPF0306 family)